MDITEHYRKLERMYLSAPVNKIHFPTTVVNIEDSKCEISIVVTSDYFHAANFLHGSIYFKLLDDTCFFAANSLVTDVFVVTTSFNINLLRPVGPGKLTAKASLSFRSKNIWSAQGELFDEGGKKVAFGTGNFVRSRMELKEEIGYV